MTGFLIAGTSSGVGKTTVTLAIIAALRRRGLVVQPFKGGPDFLDTGHHTRIAGRTSRNVDTWMLSPESNIDVLRQASQGADALIAEGMMGLFDGKSGADETGSSAEIAKLLKLPVVLVVDASKSARSIAALVLGFETFDPDLALAGVILNRVASERHFQMLEVAILTRCSTPIIGWLPRDPSIAIPERHLGLHTAEELSSDNLEQQLDTLAALGERLDIVRLLTLQCDLNLAAAPYPQTPNQTPIRIGVARDEAFSFYYEDNFDLLREHGAEIIPFSPLHDSTLPPSLDALYLGGGYPELHSSKLSKSIPMLSALRDFAISRRPIYAECGGMVYLASSLTTKDGDIHAMANILPFQVEMTPRLVRFGYVTVEFTNDCLLGPSGTVVRGHSFHYSNIAGTQDASTSYRVDYSLSGRQELEGFSIPSANILASYIHLHFRANPIVARHFIGAAIAARTANLVTA